MSTSGRQGLGRGVLGQLQLGAGFGPLMSGPLVTSIRTKGAIAAAQDYITKIRTQRAAGAGILRFGWNPMLPRWKPGEWGILRKA